MKNTILNYSTETVDNYTVSIYNSKDFYSLYKKTLLYDSSMYDYYQMGENDKLERISYELYGTANYWDILLIINNIDPLLDMYYSFDYVYDMAETTKDNYTEKISPLVNLSDDQKEYLSNFYLNMYQDKTDSHRTIKIVKPHLIQEFIRLAYNDGMFA